MNWLPIGMIFLSLTCVCYSENDTFVPTKEWQEVKPGQSIPAGLHVRIDMTSGKKEAKILEEEADQSTSDLSVVPEDSKVAQENPKISKTLSEALKNLPKNTLGLEFDPEKLEKIKKEYKSYDEIKRSLKDMKVNLKTDAEVISELIREYKNVTKEESKQAEVTRILNNFNYLVHQIDNAIWFIDEGGLESVLLPIIVNNTNTALKAQSMRVLGALSQNNPKAQIAVYEKNFGSHLSQILISSASTEELSTALYAFGSLLRKFPHAQKNILSRSGVRALVTVISKDCEMKIKAKAMTLISDLIVEKNLAVANAAHQDASQYYDLNFDEWLKANEFCQTVDGALLLRLYDLVEQADVMEYIVLALETTTPTCQRIWSESAQLRHTLLTVKNRYLHSNEEYRLEVAKLIEKLLGMLFKENAGVRDEL